MNKLQWYWNRLWRMSSAEMAYRTRTLGKAQLQKRGIGTAAQPPAPAAVQVVPWPARRGMDAAPYEAAAQRVLAGRWDVFALHNQALGMPPVWNRDPKSGIEAPLEFSKTLDYRDASRVGDIKYLWEPNRQLELVTLAQAYHLTGEARYLDGIRVLLSSWWEQCPYLRGPNWTSALELGIRLLNWALVWRLVGGSGSPLFAGGEGQQFMARWMDLIYQHAHFIEGFFSRYSSANNHLIGEASGLYAAAVVWPAWPAAQRWRARAHGILEAEALRQNAADGVNREQAVSYQQFVLDFLLLPALLDEAGMAAFSQPYWQRVEAMMEYLAAIMDVAGNVPMIGDADDGYCVRLSQEPDFCPYRSLLATGAVLFERGDFKAKSQRLDQKTLWLLGQRAVDAYERVPAADTGRLPRRFPEGGYYILGSDLDTPDEVRLTIDAGPLGYQSIAAHGHADALAIVQLSVGGTEFLVDVGTYAYHTQTMWRNYFRGTAAHNTVRIDGLDQSVIGGNFMWMSHASAACERWQQGAGSDFFEGSHDGYGRLEDPVTCRRSIALDKRTGAIDISDAVVCAGRHTVEQFWHFSEHCQVTLPEHNLVVAQCRGRTLRLKLDKAFSQIEVVAGRDDPPSGWVSRCFDVKVPASTVRASAVVDGPSSFRTAIETKSQEK